MLLPTALENHMIFKILVFLKTTVGVRFSISKDIFLGSAFYATLTDERYIGMVTRRANEGKRLSITWEADKLTDVYDTAKLLSPGLGLRLENMANGNGPPKLTGRARAEEQMRAAAADRGPAEEEEAAQAPTIVDVP